MEWDWKRALALIQANVISHLDEIVSLRNERMLKEDQSFVTRGDILLEKIIFETLGSHNATVRVVSEESFTNEVIDTAGYIVVVDPIDGTENYTSGMCEWGVSIACFNNGIHLGSMLGCPEMNLWIKSGDSVPNYFSRIRGLSSSLSKEDLIQATHGHEYRIVGCCVYNMINVIRGSYISFENPKGACTWDILGGLNLALENKLTVTVEGKPYVGEYLQANKKYRFWVGR